MVRGINMNQKYVATLLRKHCIGEGYFLYSVVLTIKGEYDKEEDSFCTMEGEEYFPYQEPAFMYSEVEYAFVNPMSFSELREKYPCKPLKEAILDYADENADKIYFATESRLENKVLTKTIDLTEMFTKEEFKDKQQEKQNFSKQDLEKMKDVLLQARDKKLTTSKAEESAKVFQEREKNLSSKEMKAKIKETVLVQDEAIDRIVTELSRMEHGEEKKGILLTGSTGVGKTKIMSMIAKYLNRPFKIVDSGQLTAPGYVGRDIEEVLYELYKDCNYNIEKTEHAILFFDEIDKKGTSSNEDVAGKAVLNILLKFLDGTTYSAHESKYAAKSIPISTNNMIIIAGGAFLDVYEKVAAKKELIGFGKKEEVQRKEPQLEDFVKLGKMTKEFMGRFPIIVHLNNLGPKDLEEILRRGKESPLQNEKEVFESLGVALKVDDSYYQKAAEVAYQRQTGARALGGIVSDSTWRAYQEIEEHPDRYDELTITKETIEDNRQFQLRERPKILQK